eukprot:122487_1
MPDNESNTNINDNNMQFFVDCMKIETPEESQPPEDHHDTLRHPFFSSDELDNEANETHKSRSQQPGKWMIRPHKTHPTQSQDHPSYTNIRSTTTCHQSYQ